MAKDIVSSNFKAKTQLLGNRSHEIRTLMTRIIGLTDLTLMTELTEEQRDYLTTVKASTGLLLSVLNDILDYSKIHAAKFELEEAPFNIRETIHEVVDLFNVAAKRKNIYIRFNGINDKIPKNIIGDSIKLKQILSNLVGNGIRFTNNGEVALKVDIEKLEQSRIHLKFMVSDTGIGIPEEKLVKLFKRSSHFNVSNTREFGGAGLATSKKLVELMNGDIYVESKAGLGSEFCFTAGFGIQGEGEIKYK